MNLKNKLISLPTYQKVGVVIIVVALLFLGIRQVKASQNNSLPTQTVQKGTVNQTVKASGNVTASGQTSVYSNANGNISELYVKNGDSVKAGQRLFRVKSTSTDIEKANAWATYMNALNGAKVANQNKLALQTQLEQARKQVLDNQVSTDIMKNNLTNNFSNPITGKGYNQIDIDSVLSNLTSARENFSTNEQKYVDADTAISAAQATQNAAWLSYQTTQDAYVTAPATGTVSNLLASVGDKVSAQTPTILQPVLTIGNFDNLYVIVTVNELNIAKVKIGQTANVTFDGIEGQSFQGIVSSIDTVGQNNQGVVSYNVRIDLKNVSVSNSPIKPGMTANVTINTQTKENTVNVPNSAIFNDQNQPTVQVLVKGKPVLTHIKTGLKGDINTEVIQGVLEGDQVVTSPTVK